MLMLHSHAAELQFALTEACSILVLLLLPETLWGAAPVPAVALLCMLVAEGHPSDAPHFACCKEAH